MVNTISDLDDPASDGQADKVPWRACVSFRRVSVVLLCLIQFGCNSVYHRTWDTLSPKPGDQLKLRLDEARKADARANQAGDRLLADLKLGSSIPVVQSDFDRLEAASRELERRVLIVRDEAGDNGEDTALTVEIERLGCHAQCWQDYVRENRREEAAVAAKQLDRLLQDSGAQ
jgi:hypothetical protein